MQLLLRPEAGEERRFAMDPVGDGFFAVDVESAGPGADYLLARDDDHPLPDPASRFQPHGVHGASRLVDLEYPWTDLDWAGRPPEELSIYEIHVGTFTPAGTYRSLQDRLDYLADLGVSCLELMPLAAFPGRHNWGYDGVFHFAPFAGYGTPSELQALVDACHGRGIAVILDLVTNHFGPVGNAMWGLAPDFFRPDKPTAWSSGINWDAEPVLRYFDGCVRHWCLDYHLDGIRLDAFHAVPSEARERHLVRMVRALDRALGTGTRRQVLLLLESVDNQVSLLRCATERVRVAQLNFDFQRSSHALLTTERHGEYSDFQRPALELGRCIEEGFAFRERRSAFHRRVRGEVETPESWDQVVNFIQNHDTCGNRYLGQRLDQLVDQDEPMRAATALLLLHPGIPFLFMGQEWGAATPFHFFIDFPEDLGRAAQQGRLGVFREMGPPPWGGETAPGCQEESARRCSLLDWSELEQERHRSLLHLVRELLAVRRRVIPEMSRELTELSLKRGGACYLIQIAPRVPGKDSFLLAANLGQEPGEMPRLGPNPELIVSTRGASDNLLPLPRWTARLYRFPPP
jgi:malto-oligosyltrehalose trehalohydrolase